MSLGSSANRTNVDQSSPRSAEQLTSLLGRWDDGPGSLHRRLTDAVAELIETGVLRSGEPLPPERRMAAALSVARGTVVDEKEMVDALVEGRLGAAGLDVFENEPNVPEALFPLENVVLLPHVGSGTVETRRAMGDLTVENLVRYFDEGTVTTPVPECAHLVAKG